MVTNKILDDAARSRYDACMNEHELRAAIARIGRTNARNKRHFQKNRAKDAYAKASLEGFKHPRKFPTRYKYG